MEPWRASGALGALLRRPGALKGAKRVARGRPSAHIMRRKGGAYFGVRLFGVPKAGRRCWNRKYGTTFLQNWIIPTTFSAEKATKTLSENRRRKRHEK